MERGVRALFKRTKTLSFFSFSPPMSFFRNLFLLLLVVNAGFLGYDYYKGGDIAQNLYENTKQLNAEKINAHVHYAYSEIKCQDPQKVVGHI